MIQIKSNILRKGEILMHNSLKIKELQEEWKKLLHQKSLSKLKKMINVQFALTNVKVIQLPYHVSIYSVWDALVIGG